jgi:proline dehydrogenase
VIRKLLLMAARQPWMQRNVPRWRWVRRAVRRFMPGETLSEALDAADRLHDEGIESVFTLLGENLSSANDARRVAAEYRELIAEAPRRGLESEVSVKLTQLGFDLDEQLTHQLMEDLARRAAETGRFVWIDMEGSAYTERTVAFYERILGQHRNAGLCLQAYLFRTPADVARLAPQRPSIRLVKGAYLEPAAIAHRPGRAVDDAYAAIALQLLRNLASGSVVRVILGTHDAELIRRIGQSAADLGIDAGRIEIQMLYGIRMDELRRLRDEGYHVRSLIAYGTFWFPWYMRRLAERPANLLFALRQLVPL